MSKEAQVEMNMIGLSKFRYLYKVYAYYSFSNFTIENSFRCTSKDWIAISEVFGIYGELQHKACVYSLLLSWVWFTSTQTKTLESLRKDKSMRGKCQPMPCSASGPNFSTGPVCSMSQHTTLSRYSRHWLRSNTSPFFSWLFCSHLPVTSSFFSWTFRKEAG